MDLSNSNIWCWILIILIGIVGFFVGYFIGKSKSPVNDGDSDVVQKLQAENSKLKADLEASRKRAQSPKSSTQSTSKTPKGKASSEKEFDADEANAAMGKRIKKDDLKIVEGIGPKIEGLFHASGIKTWKALSEISTDKCQEVLSSGGDRYRIHDPASWPMQAKMAHQGEWNALAKWQDDHKSGKF